MVAFSATSLIKHTTSVLLEEIGNSCPQRDAGRRRGEGGGWGDESPTLMHCALCVVCWRRQD